MSFVSHLRVPPMIAMINDTAIPGGGVVSDEAAEQVANGRRLC